MRLSIHACTCLQMFHIYTLVNNPNEFPAFKTVINLITASTTIKHGTHESPTNFIDALTLCVGFRIENTRAAHKPSLPTSSPQTSQILPPLCKLSHTSLTACGLLPQIIDEALTDCVSALGAQRLYRLSHLCADFSTHHRQVAHILRWRKSRLQTSSSLPHSVWSVYFSQIELYLSHIIQKSLTHSADCSTRVVRCTVLHYKNIRNEVIHVDYPDCRETILVFFLDDENEEVC